MIVLLCLILLLIEVLLVLFNILPLLEQTYLLLFNKLVSICLILLRITCKLLSIYWGTLEALFIMVLLLHLVFLPCLPIVMQTGLVIQLHFPFNNNLSNCSFYLIHMDMWGPYFVPNSDGFKYFLTVVDDATRATWIFLIKSKSKVRTLILSFYTMVHTQFRIKIKSMRSDNVLEFKLTLFYNSSGIIH